MLLSQQGRRDLKCDLCGRSRSGEISSGRSRVKDVGGVTRFSRSSGSGGESERYEGRQDVATNGAPEMGVAHGTSERSRRKGAPGYKHTSSTQETVVHVQSEVGDLATSQGLKNQMSERRV